MKFPIKQQADKSKILIVDDARQATVLLCKIFNEMEYDIFNVSNTNDALEIFERVQPGVIVLALNIPVDDTVEFLKTLKFRTENSYDGIVIISSDDESIKRCYECGVSNFLKSPFNPIQLKEMVKRSFIIKTLQDESKMFQSLLEEKVQKETEKLLKVQKDAQTANMLLEEALNEINSVNTNLKAMAVRVEAANKAKSDFFINMNHEIRTPLGGILGLAEMLASTELDRSQREYVGDIISAGNLLRQIVTDILDLSKIESGNIELDVVPVNIRHAIKDICNVISIQAEAKKVDFICSFDNNLPETVMCDSVRIRQIVLNLLTNALKFTAEGKIKFSLSVLDVNNENVTLNFVITDTGIGIPDKKLDSIFDKFSQGDLSINRRFGGSGIGLFICKLLVEKMGGVIKVSSIEGHGSTFSFDLTFPVYHGTVSDVTVPAILKWMRPPVALIVEDNLINQKIASFFLIESGCRILLAEDGENALNILKSGHVDIIFMDQSLPGMNGLDITGLIRGKLNIVSVPIIAFTANNLKESLEKCLSSGMNDYLIKPLDRNKLISLLAKHLVQLLDLQVMKPVVSAETEIDVKENAEIFNSLKLRHRLSGNEHLMNELLVIFLRKIPVAFSELQKAVIQKDIKKIYISAHTIKGMASHMSAERITNAASHIEKLALVGDAESIRERCSSELEQSINEFVNEYNKK